MINSVFNSVDADARQQASKLVSRIERYKNVSLTDNQIHALSFRKAAFILACRVGGIHWETYHELVRGASILPNVTMGRAVPS